MPEISVLMSVYNGENFITNSIESILKQVYEDFELIVVNDGSTDHTLEILQNYKDTRIKLFSFKKNQGVGTALKFGLSKAQGKYLAKADADDINHPDRLAKQKAFLDNHPDISLVKAFIEYFPHNEEVATSQRYHYYKSVMEKEKNSIVSPDQIHEILYWYCCVPHTTIMSRIEPMTEIGYADMRIWEDYYLFYQMNKKGYRMGTVEEVLVKMRLSTSSVTARTDSFDFAQVMFKIKKEEISNLFNNNTSVYIWGSGSMGSNLAQILRENGLSFNGFIDSNPEKQGTSFKEMTIYSPDILDGSSQQKIIVASQPGKFEIVDQLKQKGYKHLRDFIVLY